MRAGAAVVVAAMSAGCVAGPRAFEPEDELAWEDVCSDFADEPVDLAAVAVDGAVELTWGPGYLDDDFRGRLYRRPAAGSWELLAEVELPGGSAARFVDPDPPAGSPEYRLRLVLDCGSDGVVEGDPVRAGAVEDDAVPAIPAPEGWVSPALTVAEHCAAIRPQDVTALVSADRLVLTWRDGASPGADTYSYKAHRRTADGAWKMVSIWYVTSEERAELGAVGDTSGVRTLVVETPGDGAVEYGMSVNDGPCYPDEVVPATPVD
ncbi:hypothetical protein [Actinotalea ferrariae]|uniref:hypothetical protein n=1 Tax=Actinotalea ferrariae TaxID=1386098 RepID=UPI001C8B38AD|nr:hypothetical protein [Actinotalea ferrariae]